jgi:lipoprotein-anchoring transpeptidase ErfK/SrfK
MNVRSVAIVATVLGLAAMGGQASAQNYPASPYAPPPPPGYRGPPPPADDDDIVPMPGPYGRPSGAPYPYEAQPPGTIQRDTLPPPGQGAPYAAAPPYGGPYYQDGTSAPRGYSYGPWEAVRPPGDLNGRPLPPGPGGQPAEAAPAPGTPGYAALPPDYQPEIGKPKDLPTQFRRQMVDYPSREPAGTIIIDTPNTYLYLVLGGGKAMRYGIGVGREGFTWAGREKISRMSEWPDWHPPKEMIERQPYLPRFMAGGESNPLGARALYLGNTLYRIHGTNQPSTIGSFVSSGCIRLINSDIEDLYGRVTVGTRVVVMPGRQPPESTASVR